MRAVAKKRRDDAGKDFELHPATRRLLVGEVRRCFPKRNLDRPRLRLGFNQLWARCVSVTGLLLIIGVLGWAVWSFWGNLPRVGDTALNEADPPEQIKFSLRKQPNEDASRLMEAVVIGSNDSRLSLNLSATNAPTAEVQAQLALVAGPTNEPAKAAKEVVKVKTAGDPLALARIAQSNATLSPLIDRTLATGGVVALTERLGKKSTNAAPVPRLDPLEVNLDAEAALLADAAPTAKAAPLGSVDGVRLDRNKSVTTASAPPVAPSAPVASAIPPVAAPVQAPAPVAGARQEIAAAAVAGGLGAAANPATAPVETQRAYFARTDSADKSGQTKLGVQFGKEFGKDASTSGFLSNFELRQAGTKVQLIDADGSVYEGEVQAAVEDMARGAAPARARFSSPSAPAPAAARRTAVAPQAGFSFRAAGTNRTLSQQVVVTGTVIGDTAAPQNQLRAQDALTRSQTPRPAAGQDTTRGGNAGLFFQSQASQQNAAQLQGRVRLGTNAEELLKATQVNR